MNNPIYEKLTQVGITDLMQYANNKTGFMGAFTHTLDRYVKSEADEPVITACVLALATSENGLIGFNPASHYQDFLLKPNRKVKESLIITEWPNIQRIMASLALKETTQSIIISKLSSYERKNRTKKAMWEIDSIVRSLYMLDFIDNVTVRRNVQRALNRGESYHQLRRAISLANFGRLKARTVLEQQIWNECARLIANCIIFYNATMLSNLLAIKEEQGLHDEADLIKRVSPVAWQHINLRGRYQFRN